MMHDARCTSSTLFRQSSAHRRRPCPVRNCTMTRAHDAALESIPGDINQVPGLGGGGGGGGHSAHSLVGMCHGKVKNGGLRSGLSSSVKMQGSGAGSSMLKWGIRELTCNLYLVVGHVWLALWPSVSVTPGAGRCRNARAGCSKPAMGGDGTA